MLHSYSNAIFHLTKILRFSWWFNETILQNPTTTTRLRKISWLIHTAHTHTHTFVWSVVTNNKLQFLYSKLLCQSEITRSLWFCTVENCTLWCRASFDWQLVALANLKATTNSIRSFRFAIWYNNQPADGMTLRHWWGGVLTRRIVCVTVTRSENKNDKQHTMYSIRLGF